MRIAIWVAGLLACGDPGLQGEAIPPDASDPGPGADAAPDASPCGDTCNAGMRCVAGECERAVFATSGRFDGNLGGLAGADARCQAAATAAGLRHTFKAWLSDATVHAKDRLDRGGSGYRLLGPDGPLVATSIDAMLITITYPMPTLVMSARIDRDEYGEPSVEPLLAWTGTRPDGTSWDSVEWTNDSLTCENWTTTAHSETCGQPGYCLYGRAGKMHDLNYLGEPEPSDITWTSYAGYWCEQQFRLYCFEQP